MTFTIERNRAVDDSSGTDLPGRKSAEIRKSGTLPIFLKIFLYHLTFVTKAKDKIFESIVCIDFHNVP